MADARTPSPPRTLQELLVNEDLTLDIFDEGQDLFGGPPGIEGRTACVTKLIIKHLGVDELRAVDQQPVQELFTTLFNRANEYYNCTKTARDDMDYLGKVRDASPELDTLEITTLRGILHRLADTRRARLEQSPEHQPETPLGKEIQQFAEKVDAAYGRVMWGTTGPPADTEFLRPLTRGGVRRGCNEHDTDAIRQYMVYPWRFEG